jgi:hypothetical protein
MSNKITNPFLKQLISGISQKANQGRMTGVDWNILEEAKKNKKVAKKTLKKESDEKKPSQQPEDRYEWENDPYHSRQFEKSDVSWREYDKKMNPESYRVKEADEKKNPADDAGEEDAGGLPPLGGKDEAPTNKPKAKTGGKDAGADAPPDGGKEDAGTDPTAGLGDEEGAGAEEDSEEAQSDAAEAKAELEKAKAEKDQAEKEIKKHSYIKLGSNSGTQFLLGKILDHAFKTNTIDALAGEMVQKLKITTPDDINAFSEETASYRVIPGFPELLSSMKTMATKQPEETEEEPSA